MVEQQEENGLSSEFSFDSYGAPEEYNQVLSVQSTIPQRGFRQEDFSTGRNEFHLLETTSDKYETINNAAETNYPKIMNQHNHLNQQPQPSEIQQETSSETKPSESSNRRVSIIDETNRTRDKISKKRRKKTTRLRKPLQNDELLKNYFEMDTVSSNQVTTFKIIQSSDATSSKDTSQTLLNDQQQGDASESFITKETFQVSNTKDSKLSESGEESNNRTSISSLANSSHTIPPSSYFHNYPITLQELMNSELMQQFQLDSNNNRNASTESALHHSISSNPPLLDTNPQTFQIPLQDLNNQSNSPLNNEIPLQNHHETDNFIVSSDFSQFNENLDLLQFLMQLTDTSATSEQQANREKQ